MVIPDVVGFMLEDAIKELNEAGYVVSNIFLTTQPRNVSNSYDLSCRVLRIKASIDKKVELLVCKPTTITPL